MKFRLAANVAEQEIAQLFLSSELIDGKLWVELATLEDLVSIAIATAGKYNLWPEVDPTYDWSKPGIVTLHFRTNYDD